MKQVTLKLPAIVRFGDYHEFDDLKETLQALGAKYVKVRELGCDYDYYGVVYTGRLADAKKEPKVAKIVSHLKSLDGEF